MAIPTLHIENERGKVEKSFILFISLKIKKIHMERVLDEPHPHLSPIKMMRSLTFELLCNYLRYIGHCHLQENYT